MHENVPTHDNHTVSALASLCESLERKSKAKVVDPLINRLKRALARRFRAQARAYRTTGDIALSDEDNRAFRQAFAAAVGLAFASGEQFASAQLDATSGPGRYRRSVEELESEMDKTTRGRLAGLGALAIAALFADWQTSRAEGIAVNEISSAYHGGAAAVARSVVVGGAVIEKHWDADANACEICQANSADGWIPEDILFASGDSEPGAHPHCMCSVSYRRKE